MVFISQVSHSQKVTPTSKTDMAAAYSWTLYLLIPLAPTGIANELETAKENKYQEVGPVCYLAA